MPAPSPDGRAGGSPPCVVPSWQWQRIN